VSRNSGYCIGAPLARIELHAVFSQLAPRFPTMALTGPLDDLQIHDNLVAGGLVELAVTDYRGTATPRTSGTENGPTVPPRSSKGAGCIGRVPRQLAGAEFCGRTTDSALKRHRPDASVQRPQLRQLAPTHPPGR
jgi:hypothetical protein